MNAGDAAALCVAGEAIGDIYIIYFCLAWQAWHLVKSTFVLRGRPGTYGTGWRAWVGFSRRWRRGTLHGRRGTWSHPLSFCVAGMALMALGGALGPALVAGDAAALCVVWHLATSTFVWRGRRGTWSHPPSFCVAGVALIALGGALGSVLVAGDAAALCVAAGIYLRFARQAWRLCHWAGSGGALGLVLVAGDL